MDKKVLIALIVFFAITTVIVYMSDDTSKIKQISIKTQTTQIAQKGTLLSDSIESIKFQNTDTEFIKNKKVQYSNSKSYAPPIPEPVQYIYRSLNWNDWRSDFLNRILDDTDSIKGLNQYSAGTVIWFSFDVTNKGEVKKIQVIAPQLRKQEKLQFRKLLKSYAYTNTTKFPPYSKRKRVKVKSFLILDQSERRAHPEDFYDREIIR